MKLITITAEEAQSIVEGLDTNLDELETLAESDPDNYAATYRRVSEIYDRLTAELEKS